MQIQIFSHKNEEVYLLGQIMQFQAHILHFFQSHQLHLCLNMVGLRLLGHIFHDVEV